MVACCWSSKLFDHQAKFCQGTVQELQRGQPQLDELAVIGHLNRTLLVLLFFNISCFFAVWELNEDEILLFLTYLASLQCENLLKTETAKFQSIYEKFNKEKATHLQSLKGTFSSLSFPQQRGLFVACTASGHCVSSLTTSYISWDIMLENFAIFYGAKLNTVPEFQLD